MDDNQLKIGNPYKGKKFIGTVANNVDPYKLFRLQIMVPRVFDSYTTAQLPWAIPGSHTGLGETGSASDCKVPLIGAPVYVEFQDGDPHYPVYSVATILNSLNALFQTNYPSRYGCVDPNGNHLYVDMSTGDLEVRHQSGTILHINPNGSVTVTTVGNITSTAPLWTHNGPFVLNGNQTTNGNTTIIGLTTTNTLNVL